MLTVSVAVLPSCGQVTVTVTGTVPSCAGAVQGVSFAVAFAKVPLGADHAYVTEQPIEDCGIAVSVEILPTSTEHGLHCALTVRSCAGAGGAGAGGGGGGGGAT